MGYSFWLAAWVLLYAPSHRQDSTYHDLCYTSRGALAGTRNSSMGPPWRTDLTIHRIMSEHSYLGATSRSCFNKDAIKYILNFFKNHIYYGLRMNNTCQNHFYYKLQNMENIFGQNYLGWGEERQLARDWQFWYLPPTNVCHSMTFQHNDAVEFYWFFWTL